jgi:hypothetical protein
MMRPGGCDLGQRIHHRGARPGPRDWLLTDSSGRFLTPTVTPTGLDVAGLPRMLTAQSWHPRTRYGPRWTSLDGHTTNWKCGIRGNSDRGFESLSLRVSYSNPLHLISVCDAIGEILEQII